MPLATSLYGSKIAIDLIYIRADLLYNAAWIVTMRREIAYNMWYKGLHTVATNYPAMKAATARWE